MSDELREAAERLAVGDTSANYACFHEAIRATKALADGIALAEVYLSEHPQDDEEPATKEWLLGVGWNKEDHPNKLNIHRHDAMSIGLWCVDDGWKAMLIHHEHAQSCIVRGMKTRGDVRRLCKALVIPLKEASKPS